MSPLDFEWLPSVYKKITTGRLRVWTVGYSASGIYRVKFGVHKGKIITRDTQCKSMNMGRANQRLPHEQAKFTAENLLRRQIERQQYSPSLNDVVNNPAPTPPMEYAGKLTKKKLDNSTGKVIVQPKIDGLNTHLAKTAFKSRKHDSYPALMEMHKELRRSQYFEELFRYGMLNFETYTKAPLNLIDGTMWSKYSDIIQDDAKLKILDGTLFYVYDIIPNEANVKATYLERMAMAKSTLNLANKILKEERFVFIETSYINYNNEFDMHLKIHYDKYLEKGLEGAMVKNPLNKYSAARQHDMQKIKPVFDDEFKCVGVMLTKPVGDVQQANLLLRTSEGAEFQVRMKGANKVREDIALNPRKYRDKWIKVEYRGIHGETGKPFHAVGVGVRND